LTVILPTLHIGVVGFDAVADGPGAAAVAVGTAAVGRGLPAAVGFVDPEHAVAPHRTMSAIAATPVRLPIIVSSFCGRGCGSP
jgi:hypothetical protein